MKILSYTLNPDANYNLTTELKNVKDNKKSDGAIIINEQVKVVIELKGINTTDLNKIETQRLVDKPRESNNQKVIFRLFSFQKKVALKFSRPNR